jgi:triphosphatase
MELELRLNPDHAARLSRLPLLTPLRNGRTRSRPLRIVWHDSADRALAGKGLILVEQRPQWRLEQLYPDGAPWPPGGIAPVLAVGRTLTEALPDLPDPLLPVAAFEGRSTAYHLSTAPGYVTMTVLNGVVRAVASEHAVCRVRFEGPPQAVQEVALALTGELDLAVPHCCLAADALASASGTLPVPRRQGAPELPASASIPEAFAHVVGHLSDVLLYHAPAASLGQDGPESVHQMRVAVRRLRSAIKVFRRAIRSPLVDAADAGLKVLAAKLAPTRDWDVFATETVPEVAGVFAADKRMARLLAAVERRRRICHDELRAYLTSADFRRLGIELACLAGRQDWYTLLDESQHAELTTELQAFAAKMLNKRLKRVHPDGDLAHMEPASLHALRLCAKRLRYAAEIFAPLYPAKAAARFIRRVGKLQDQLGELNDAAVASSLLAELNGNGSGHAFATGLVLGFISARNRRTRGRIDKAWDRFAKLSPFWE